MELLWILLAIVAIFAASYLRQREYMTNADVKSALQKYAGETDTPQKYDSTGVSEYPIYGPTIKHPPVEPSTEGGGSKNKTKPSGVYPDIYGPDVELIPGTKPRDPKHKSDDTSDSTYDFNPDLSKAFPTSGPPQPYLTDFSGFQH
jgi:hypothetical protein